MSKNNHDDHYKNFEKVLGHQPITVMEAVACNGLPQEFHAQAKRNLHVAMAIKYLLRLGSKDEANKEINKAENFLYRARTGSWRPVAEDLPLFATPEKSCLGCQYRWTTEDRKPFCTFPGLLCVDFDRYDAGEAPKKALTAANRKPIVSGDRGPTVTVTTHGKTAEATEAEVGKAVANLRGVPTPNAPAQAMLTDCSTCKRGKNNGPNVGDMSCKMCFMYASWEPKPEEARVVPRGCASCEDGPSPSHCKLFHERRCGDIGSSFPLWKAKA